ncbi:MAG: hypothetical protein C0514_02375 [Candidatus Puniceispirillum sp.]|nr:hypothetical protein [Candidatus Puniceispirillum sp.]
MKHIKFITLLITVPFIVTTLPASTPSATTTRAPSTSTHALSSEEVAKLHALLGGPSDISLEVKLNFLKDKIGGSEPTILGRVEGLAKEFDAPYDVRQTVQALKKVLGFQPLFSDIAQTLVEVRLSAATSQRLTKPQKLAATQAKTVRDLMRALG